MSILGGDALGRLALGQLGQAMAAPVVVVAIGGGTSSAALARRRHQQARTVFKPVERARPAKPPQPPPVALPPPWLAKRQPPPPSPPKAPVDLADAGVLAAMPGIAARVRQAEMASAEKRRLQDEQDIADVLAMLETQE